MMVNPEVDAYIERSHKWPEEMTGLRPILLSCGLTEQIKWGKPCYTHGGKNIAILQEMKDFLALMFFKGALLKDAEGVLEEQGPNSRSARRTRYRSEVLWTGNCRWPRRQHLPRLLAWACILSPRPAQLLWPKYRLKFQTKSHHNSPSRPSSSSA